ncbi:hypothetical protein ABIE09_001475 [Lysobacter enzymogenes]|uniref:hypothetical protein n=1 Tax=Lysobacter enzymogenes TaxID=69 RepID=UPI0033909CC7
MVASLVAALPVVAFAETPSTTEWIARQTVDPMTDVRDCAVREKGHEVSPLFYYRPDTGWGLVISNADFPGRPVRVRVDKYKAIGGEGEASMVLRRVRSTSKSGQSGPHFSRNHYEWPNDYKIVRGLNLEGVVEKLNECERWAKGNHLLAPTK